MSLLGDYWEVRRMIAMRIKVRDRWPVYRRPRRRQPMYLHFKPTVWHGRCPAFRPRTDEDRTPTRL